MVGIWKLTSHLRWTRRGSDSSHLAFSCRRPWPRRPKSWESKRPLAGRERLGKFHSAQFQSSCGTSWLIQDVCCLCTPHGFEWRWLCARRHGGIRLNSCRLQRASCALHSIVVPSINRKTSGLSFHEEPTVSEMKLTHGVFFQNLKFLSCPLA